MASGTSAAQDEDQVYLPSENWNDFLEDPRCRRLEPKKFTNSLAINIFNRCPYATVASVLRKMAPTDDYFLDIPDKNVVSSAQCLAQKKKKHAHK